MWSCASVIGVYSPALLLGGVRYIRTLPKPLTKVTIVKEGSGQGSVGDIISVKRGFARNFLIPRGFVAYTNTAAAALAARAAGKEKQSKAAEAQEAERVRPPSID